LHVAKLQQKWIFAFYNLSLAFLLTNFQASSNIQSPNGPIGQFRFGGDLMKRTITVALATFSISAFGVTANAADLRRPAPAAPAYVAPMYNWTGLYVGAHIGGGWSSKDFANYDPLLGPVGNFGSVDADGFLGGVQLGYNWQTGPWVFGVEAQFSWADLSGSGVSSAFPGVSGYVDINNLGSIAGRIGYAWDRTMLYFKGGAGWVNERYSLSDGITIATADGDTRWGWMLGAGLEYGWTPNWSVKIEYNYMDFGSDSVSFVEPGFTPFSLSIDQQVHVVKAGVNYRFGGLGKAPVMTRY
jgi:outer membrane immunogenic protein